ncbi:GntR family transcriptional regulator [Roseomonas sp. NAR14]|uniref:GntR family transcriptional regulator n=1 Tax=Roseomonas acroporae TaxID=2937791 RepID=A0A9X1YE24_9PROT|nr:GntR family transcriptional regulator [Roseomonas acroporae]MCK8786992.1 GntR family transcriptional regulator [Roseomonas acroporae]
MDEASARGGERAAVDDIVEQLENEILSGALGPGERLSEQTLSARFGVSRGPLREAVRTLEGRRLLERTPFAGVRVVNPSLADLEHLLTVREALEGTACRLAAENMSLIETRRLRACLGDYERRIETEGLGSVFRRGSRDNDFHVQIVQGSHNPWLHALLCRDLYSILRVVRLRSVGLGSRAQRAAEEHLAILQAIERRDPDAAEQLMRRHIRVGRENLLRLQAAEAAT